MVKQYDGEMLKWWCDTRMNVKKGEMVKQICEVNLLYVIIE